MRQITFANQSSFEKHAQISRREGFSCVMEWLFRGMSWKH